jgi:hypothetical protein
VANSNQAFYNNTLSACDHGIAIAMGGPNSTLAGLSLYGNDISNFQNWDDNGNSNHHDGIHIWSYNSGDVISTSLVYNNYIHGDFGNNFNAAIYTEAEGFSTNMPTPAYFNNIIVDQDSVTHLGCGEICLDILNAPLVANNTVSAPSGFGSVGISLYYTTSSTLVYNNTIQQVEEAVGLASASFGTASDYNNYYLIGSNGWNFSSTFAAWKTACSCDSHGSNTNPNLNGIYQPTSGSPLIHAGTNLTSLSITALNSDYAGLARPTTGAWDIGAYQYAASASTSSFFSGVLSGVIQ